jgi:hypothetical protein
VSGLSGKSAGFDLLNKIISLLYFGFLVVLFFLIKQESLKKRVVFDFKHFSQSLSGNPKNDISKELAPEVYLSEKTDNNYSSLKKFDCLFKNKSAKHFLELGKKSEKQVVVGFLFNIAQQVSRESFQKKEFLRRQPKYQEFHLAGYKKELAKHFEVSMRMAVANADPSMQKLYSKFGRHVKFFLEINRDGSIKNLELTPKTALDDFNIFFINAIRSAAPFPPIPNFFKNSSFIF